MRAAGYAVETAGGPAQAKALLTRPARRKRPYDAVVLDLRGAGALSLAETVRALPEPVALIGLAGLGLLYGNARSSVSFDAIVPRPVDTGRLREVLAEVLSGEAVEARFADAVRRSALREAQVAAFGAVAALLHSRADLPQLLRATLRPFVEAEAFDFAAVYLPASDGGWSLAAADPTATGAALAQLPGLLGACESAPIQLPDPRWPDADALLGRQGLVAARLCPLQSAELRAIVAVGSADPRFQDYGAALLQAVLPQWLVALTLAVSMARLSASEDRFHTLADTLPRGLLATDEDDHITYANAAASQLLATPQLVGRRLEEVLPRGVGPTLARGDRVIDVGLRRYADHLGRQHTTVVLTDASEQHRRERDLRDAATHDGLTGLLNRRGLELEAARLLTELAQRGAPAVVMVLDLDRFKAVNDAQGHPAGDRLLRRVAAELRRGLRTTDLLARPGGDEFVMLCPDARPESAATLGRTVRAAVQRAAAAEGADVDASVGVACFPGHGVDAGALIARADAAMYAAKRAGGASVQGAEAVAGASTTSSR